MPQLPEGQPWPYMSSHEILIQMHERFTFAQQFMNTLPEPMLGDELGNGQISIPRHVIENQKINLDIDDVVDVPGYSLTEYPVIREPRSYYTLWPVYEELISPTGIGDLACANNAKSAHLRCAINPCGPCEGCLDYQPGVGGGGGAE